jgi:hypothetical protein
MKKYFSIKRFLRNTYKVEIYSTDDKKASKFDLSGLDEAVEKYGLPIMVDLHVRGKIQRSILDKKLVDNLNELSNILDSGKCKAYIDIYEKGKAPKD